MAPVNKVTITGTLGPDVDVTSLVLNDVTNIKFELDRRVIEITHGAQPKIVHFDYEITATVTFTIGGDNTTIVIT